MSKDDPAQQNSYDILSCILRPLSPLLFFCLRSRTGQSSTFPQYFSVPLIYGASGMRAAAIHSHGVQFQTGDNTWTEYLQFNLQNEL